MPPLRSGPLKCAGRGNTTNAGHSDGAQDVHRYVSFSAGADPLEFLASRTARLAALCLLLAAPRKSSGRSPEPPSARAVTKPLLQVGAERRPGLRVEALHGRRKERQMIRHGPDSPALAPAGVRRNVRPIDVPVRAVRLRPEGHRSRRLIRPAKAAIVFEEVQTRSDRGVRARRSGHEPDFARSVALDVGHASHQGLGPLREPGVRGGLHGVGELVSPQFFAARIQGDKRIDVDDPVCWFGGRSGHRRAGQGTLRRVPACSRSRTPNHRRDSGHECERRACGRQLE